MDNQLFQVNPLKFPRIKMPKNPIFWSVLVSILISSVISFSAGVLGSQYFNSYTQSIFEKIKIPQLGEKVIEKETVVKEYQPQTTQEQQIIDVVKSASPAVVSVIATKDVPVIEQYYTNPFQGFDQFFGPGVEFQVPQYRQKGTQKQQVSAGTGFIVSSDGLILTNRHVVEATDVEYTVLTNNGEKYPAKVLARDPIQDLAIIKIEKSNLPQVKLGNSDNIQTGQTVIAIGNALGEFRNTVSVGVVSGLSRSITASGGGASETIDDVIQTDAAINPGNSGGPLLNLRGEVIGVNVAMVSGAQNIAFSIPVNKAQKAINDIKTKGKITYPSIGVRYVIITPELKDQNKLPVDYGALIMRGDNANEFAVIPGSPADKAGLVENDIILEMDGQKITIDNSLAKMIQKHSVGDTVTLRVYHKGEEKVVKVVLGER